VALVHRRRLLTTLAAATILPTRLRAAERLEVVCFPGATSLPLVAANRQGFFRKRDLDLAITFTPNSQQLREGLASGRYHVAHAAVDNAVAMQELTGTRIAVVVGGDNGFNSLFAQAGIETIGALRGALVTVDAPNTAYAFQLYKMLQLNGLSRSDYTIRSVGATDLRLEAMLTDKQQAASMLSLGSAARARAAGFKDLGRAVDVIGPYLASSGFVLRERAQADGDVLARYVAAYIEGVRWVRNRDNKDAVVNVLVDQYRLDRALAEPVWAILSDERTGVTRDAEIDVEGFANVLALRAELEGQWGGHAPAPGTYIDDRHYRAALKSL
jgi:ABC-type nitrate/sulfonate/bicarbonate transport system substrate-binding protein